MKRSTVRTGVSDVLSKEGLGCRVTEVLAVKSPRQGRILYLVHDIDPEDLLARIKAMLEKEGFEVSTEDFADLDTLTTAPVVDDRDKIYNNRRGRTLRASFLLPLDQEKFQESVLSSTWVLKVSKHEGEYFSMLDMYPSFFQPSQQVAGVADAKESIRTPLSWLRGIQVQGLLDSHDDLILGVVGMNRKITYGSRYHLGKSEDWLSDDGFDNLLAKFTDEAVAGLENSRGQ